MFTDSQQMLRDIEKKIPGFIFEEPGDFISYGVKNVDKADVNHIYAAFKQKGGLFPEFKRGVANLDVSDTTDKKVEVMYLVYLRSDEIDKDYQVYAEKETGWECWGGIEVKVLFGTWAGYLLVLGKTTGDPPIAVG